MAPTRCPGRVIQPRVGERGPTSHRHADGKNAVFWLNFWLRFLGVLLRALEWVSWMGYSGPIDTVQVPFTITAARQSQAATPYARGRKLSLLPSGRGQG